MRRDLTVYDLFATGVEGTSSFVRTRNMVFGPVLSVKYSIERKR